MGLDMFLERRQFIGANYKHRNVKGTINLTEGEENTPIKVALSKIFAIVYLEVYWRKANAIHAWFVANCQDGVDECQESYVSTEKLQELLATCQQVLDALEKHEDASKAAELLPPQAGFFFGSTDIDQGYVEDLKYTVTEIQRLLAECPDGDFYYSASW